MALVPVSGPAVEPVSLAEAKAHLRVTGAAEDLLVASLVTAARVHIELTLSRAFITQGWSWFIDAWPAGATLPLPLSPVQSIGAIRVLAAGDEIVTLPPSAYLLDGAAQPSRVIAKSGSWRDGTPAPAYAANGIEIQLIAGYGPLPSDVPQPIRQAILLLAAHWFERREAVEIGQPSLPLPVMVGDLLSPFREVRL
ncbi:MAG: hypothetical protein HXY23_15135 [Parvularculaceae bacterium]|nr:hypothetical protein [Parvularculaceae bacterium]